MGRVIHRYKVAKYFKVTIQAGFFRFETRPERIQQDRDLDGIYVVRTSESEKRLPTEDVVRSYKNLSKVEQAFRSLKQIDLWVRPIYHRLEDRVRAHIFVCMLAYYVVWHMRKALAPLLFEDEALDQNRQKRDPVLPTQPSRSAQEKKRTQQTANGFPVHSFTTLMQDLSTCARSDCRLRLDKSAPIVKRVTELTPLHREAFSLLGLFPSNGH